MMKFSLFNVKTSERTPSGTNGCKMLMMMRMMVRMMVMVAVIVMVTSAACAG